MLSTVSFRCTLRQIERLHIHGCLSAASAVKRFVSSTHNNFDNKSLADSLIVFVHKSPSFF